MHIFCVTLIFVNYFFKRIALILILIMLAPPVFAFGKTKHKEVRPVENQEVIHLDVTKNDSDLSEENKFLKIQNKKMMIGCKKI